MFAISEQQRKQKKEADPEVGLSFHKKKTGYNQTTVLVARQ
jgi:hypothetical protein